MSKKQFLVIISVLLCGFVPEASAAERSFLMGLTPMNFDGSPAGTKRMKETLAKHAEVVAVYMDWGVPWPEAFEEKPFHENVRKEIAATKERISREHQVFLALNAGAFNRREMAGYWGQTNMMPRPGKWADKTFDDPDVILAFGNYCERMIAEFKPSFLAYALEINMMAGAEPKRFDQFTVLAERVYARLKAKHPELIIFPTFQIDFGVAGNPGGEKIVRRLMPHSDAIAISSYPHIRGFTPDTLPAGWLADVRKLAPDKFFIIAENGFPAAPFKGEWFKQPIAVASAPGMQAAYVRWLLAEAQRLDARLVTWFFPSDINVYLEEQKRLNGLENQLVTIADMAMNLGLMDGTFQPRSALDEWTKWKQRKVKR